MTNIDPKTKEYPCKQCGTKVYRAPSELRSKYVFCSRSCAATFNNKNKIIFKECPECHTSFRPTRGEKGVFCSPKCAGDNRRNKVYLDIENGKVNGHSRSTLSSYLQTKRGRKCEICGITEWQNIPIVVILDHINGNADDNHLENLRLVCSNCDANLPTYKSKNIGNGRTYRKNGACCQNRTDASALQGPRATIITKQAN